MAELPSLTAWPCPVNGETLMGKKWQRSCVSLLQVFEIKCQGFDEVHVIFDRYDMPNSLKERTRDLRQGTQRSISYYLSDDAIIEKVSQVKQLLNNQENKQRIALHLYSIAHHDHEQGI
jgi:hypothetical protein